MAIPTETSRWPYLCLQNKVHDNVTFQQKHLKLHNHPIGKRDKLPFSKKSCISSAKHTIKAKVLHEIFIFIPARSGRCHGNGLWGMQGRFSMGRNEKRKSPAGEGLTRLGLRADVSWKDVTRRNVRSTPPDVLPKALQGLLRARRSSLPPPHDVER